MGYLNKFQNNFLSFQTFFWFSTAFLKRIILSVALSFHIFNDVYRQLPLVHHFSDAELCTRSFHCSIDYLRITSGFLYTYLWHSWPQEYRFFEMRICHERSNASAIVQRVYQVISLPLNYLYPFCLSILNAKCQVIEREIMRCANQAYILLWSTMKRPGLLCWYASFITMLNLFFPLWTEYDILNKKATSSIDSEFSKMSNSMNASSIQQIWEIINLIWVGLD